MSSLTFASFASSILSPARNAARFRSQRKGCGVYSIVFLISSHFRADSHHWAIWDQSPPHASDIYSTTALQYTSAVCCAALSR